MTKRKRHPNEQLSAFLDGELPPDGAAEVERRLSADHDLRVELEELAEVKRLVGGLERVAAPASVGAAIRGRLERRSLLSQRELAAGPSRRWMRFARLSAAAAVLMIAAALTFTVWRHVYPGGLAPPEAPPGARVVAGDQPVHKLGPAGEAVAAGTRRADSPMGKLAKGGPTDVPPDYPVWAKGGPGGPGRVVMDRPVNDGHGRAAQSGRGREALGKNGRPLRAPAKARGGWAGDGKLALARSVEQPPGTELLALQLRRRAVRPRDVMSYDFDREPLELSVPADDPHQQEQFNDDLRGLLMSNGAAPVEQLGANITLTADDHQFFYQGRADDNFRRTAPRQDVYVVRVRRDVAEQLIAEAKNETAGRAAVRTRATPALRGRQLAQVQGQDAVAQVPTGVSQKRADGGAAPGAAAPRPSPDRMGYKEAAPAVEPRAVAKRLADSNAAQGKAAGHAPTGAEGGQAGTPADGAAGQAAAQRRGQANAAATPAPSVQPTAPPAPSPERPGSDAEGAAQADQVVAGGSRTAAPPAPASTVAPPGPGERAPAPMAAPVAPPGGGQRVALEPKSQTDAPAPPAPREPVAEPPAGPPVVVHQRVAGTFGVGKPTVGPSQPPRGRVAPFAAAAPTTQPRALAELPARPAEIGKSDQRWAKDKAGAEARDAQVAAALEALPGERLRREQFEQLKTAALKAEMEQVADDDWVSLVVNIYVAGPTRQAGEPGPGDAHLAAPASQMEERLLSKPARNGEQAP